MVFEDLGEKLVKNIAHPIRAFRLRIADDMPNGKPANCEGILDELDNPETSPAIAGLSADTDAALELAFGVASRTAPLPNSKPTSRNIQRAPSHL
jgi:hypothetical protein